MSTKLWKPIVSIAGALFSFPFILTAQIAIGEYTIPFRGGQGVDITAGPDGALWFNEDPSNTTEHGGIGRMTTAGGFNVFLLPPYPANETNSITAGPDGALWYTTYQVNAISRITTAGHITSYPIPTANSGAIGLTVGPDGALWFTESTANQIGRITTAGVVTEYPVPTANSGPNAIAAGPDGALWFTEYNANKIGRITTAGHVTEYPIPTAGSQPTSIAAGPDQAMWFTEFNANQIGRIGRAGAVTEYGVPSPVSELGTIVLGPDSAMWFTEFNGGKLGRIATDGAITEYPIPAPLGALPNGLALGPYGSLWFTDDENGAIGQAVFPTATLTAAPNSGAYEATVSLNASGFLPGENVQVYSSGIGSAVLASGTANSGGAVALTGSVPNTAYGPRLFLATGQSSGKIAAANFTTLSKLVLSPETGPVGTTVTAQGFGFGSFDLVTITWDDPREFLGRVNADANGNFSGFTFTVPANATVGRDAVLGTDFVPGAHAFFTVE